MEDGCYWGNGDNEKTYFQRNHFILRLNDWIDRKFKI